MFMNSIILLDFSFIFIYRFVVGKDGLPNPLNFTFRLVSLNWRLHLLSICTLRDSALLRIFLTFFRYPTLAARLLEDLEYPRLRSWLLTTRN